MSDSKYRRSAREVAMRYLYLRDMNGECAGAPLAEADGADASAAPTGCGETGPRLERATELRRDPLLVEVSDLSARDRAFVERAEKLYPEREKEIDAIIAAHLKKWRLDRVARVDLAILRLAVLEILAMGTPPKTAVNEAVELAKAYSSDDAYRFVNGVLAGYLKTI